MLKKGLTHAYAQAPWRLHTQKGALFLIGMFLVGCVIWIMLSISVEASEAGLEIQVMTSEEQVLMREIAHLRSKMAERTASVEMIARAEAMGFRPATLGDVTYVVVPGYRARQTEISAPPPGSDLPPLLLKNTYTESLSEWLYKGALRLSEKQGEILR